MANDPRPDVYRGPYSRAMGDIDAMPTPEQSNPRCEPIGYAAASTLLPHLEEARQATKLLARSSPYPDMATREQTMINALVAIYRLGLLIEAGDDGDMTYHSTAMMNAVTAGAVLVANYPGHPELQEWLSLPDDTRTLQGALVSAECIVDSIVEAGPLSRPSVAENWRPAVLDVLGDYTRRHIGSEGHQHD